MRILGFLLAFFFAANAFAAMYRCMDEQGNPVFTDVPCAGGEEVTLPPGTTFTPRLPAASTSKEASKEETAPGYNWLRVASPGPDETVRNTTGEVNIELDLEPGLQGDDRIALYLDGTRLSPTGTGVFITLNNIDRGTHTVQARVVSPDGDTRIASDPVTFHLHRSENLPREQAPTKAPSAPISPRAPRAF